MALLAKTCSDSAKSLQIKGLKTEQKKCRIQRVNEIWPIVQMVYDWLLHSFGTEKYRTVAHKGNTLKLIINTVNTYMLRLRGQKEGQREGGKETEFKRRTWGNRRLQRKVERDSRRRVRGRKWGKEGVEGRERCWGGRGGGEGETERERDKKKNRAHEKKRERLLR